MKVLGSRNATTGEQLAGWLASCPSLRRTLFTSPHLTSTQSSPSRQTQPCLLSFPPPHPISSSSATPHRTASPPPSLKPTNPSPTPSLGQCEAPLSLCRRSCPLLGPFRRCSKTAGGKASRQAVCLADWLAAFVGGPAGKKGGYAVKSTATAGRGWFLFRLLAVCPRRPSA